jgi:hypothetical protein
MSVCHSEVGCQYVGAVTAGAGRGAGPASVQVHSRYEGGEV